MHNPISSGPIGSGALGGEGGGKGVVGERASAAACASNSGQ